METDENDRPCDDEGSEGKQEGDTEEIGDQELTDNPLEEEKENGDVEQICDDVDDDMASIASSDLSMADEAGANSDEEEEEEDEDELPSELLETSTYDPIEHFDPDTLTLSATKHIRPPWFKQPPDECDAKNWEIFVEALEAFDRDVIYEGIDDFIVTIETLLPHLPSCFVTLKKDAVMSEKEAGGRIMIWLEVCLSKEVQAFDEAKKMQNIAFAILKVLAESAKSAVVGKQLIDSGMMELLLFILEESECSELRMSALYSVFQLICSPVLWRAAHARLTDDSALTLYSRIVALSFGERYFINKKFLHLVTLLMSWTRFVSSLIELENASRSLFAAVFTADKFADMPTLSFSEKWKGFLLSFNTLHEYIVEFDDEKVCATFDIYALLQTSDILGICVRLLGMTRVTDRWPNVLEFIQILLNDKYYGTLFILHDVELPRLYTELKLLGDFEKNHNKVFEPSDRFDEGVCEVEEKFPCAAELRLTLAYRLRALQLLDEIRGCAGSLRHDIDDDVRVSALMSLCELSNDERGRREVVWTLAQKYLYYLTDIIEYTSAHPRHRSSVSFSLSVHLLVTVVSEVDEPKFWIRNAKTFHKLLSKAALTYNTHKTLFDYLSPFTDASMQNIGKGGLEVLSTVVKKIGPSTAKRQELPPHVITCTRILEAVIISANDTTRMEILHAMEQDDTFTLLTNWLHNLVQVRHALWQMGEPASSEASRHFLRFAVPVLRIFTTYMTVYTGVVGDLIKQVMSSSLNQSRNKFIRWRSDIFVQLRDLGDAILDVLLLMWSTSGGINGQKFSPECRRIRQAVLEVLTPTLFYEKSLAVVIRHVFSQCCPRPQLFAAGLSLLMNLAPWAPPLVLAKDEMPSWKDVVIGHRQRVDRFVNAFTSCENRADFAEVLLAPSPYISELSYAFVDRMSRLDHRMARDLAGILLNHVLTTIKTRSSRKRESLEKVDRGDTPNGSVAGDEHSKENEDHRPVTTGMVRTMESFVHLCGVKSFRLAVFDFFRFPSQLKYLLPLLSQLEKPTFESERQLRFQNSVLELLSRFCCHSHWSTEVDLESNVYGGDSFLELNPLLSEQSNSNAPDQVKENGENLTAEIIEDGEDDTVTALELVEETDSESKPISTLEAIISSLCRLMNNSDQKISPVRGALEILKRATANGKDNDNTAFFDVIRGCMQRICLRPLLDKLNLSFGGPEVMDCLMALATILDGLLGDRTKELYQVLDFTSSNHPLVSIIAKINDLREPDASAKCVLKMLDKIFQSLNAYSAAEKTDPEDVKIPLVYGTCEPARKALTRPLVDAVAGRGEQWKRIRKASSILIRPHRTPGTRMGSEVAKIIETHRGQEKAVRQLLQSQLEIAKPSFHSSPRKRARSQSDKSNPAIKQKKT
ncbi:hypothetical protein Q1695_008485 [Nippostrongylus brasiliensis]|nr:hypothetical protein Q1695_008485 [Nippostrongylus brasiliensis]